MTINNDKVTVVVTDGAANITKAIRRQLELSPDDAQRCETVKYCVIIN